MKDLEKKYLELFLDFDKGNISEDEVYLRIYLGEGRIDKKEFDYWMNKLNCNLLGHPKLIEFNKKYNAILTHYRRGNCSIQDILDAIEVLEKFKELD